MLEVITKPSTQNHPLLDNNNDTNNNNNNNNNKIAMLVLELK